MIRVLHVVTDLNTGGAELVLKRLVESHLGNPCYEHRVVSLRTLGTIGPPLQAQGVPVVALGLDSLRGLPVTFWRLVRIIRSVRPNVVQTWMYHSDLLGGVAARLAGCRSILWSVRASQINVGVVRATHVARWICARVSRWIPSAISYVAESARQSHERLGYDPSKAVVIVNGFKLPELAPASARGKRLRDELGLDRSAILVGSAARFHPQKGHRLFVGACAQVAEAIPEAHFVMAGWQVERSNGLLLEWIGETGHAHRFHLLGERRDLDHLFGELDLFCLHSLEEGFPNVLGEAMAAAAPCVTTNVGDAAALVGDTGIVAPPDVDALATAMIGLLERPVEERRRLGRRARERVRRHFSMDAARTRFEKAYQQLVGAGAREAGDDGCQIGHAPVQQED
jgi:glycosyltransferase involved in cell wall biosynthesis